MEDGKVLIAYASKYGSTAEVAERIGTTLQEAGLQVDVRSVQDVKDLSPYRTVVVGGGIYAGKWHSDAVKFVNQHRNELKVTPVACFAVAGTLKDDTPENRAKIERALAPIREIVAPVSVGLFAGALDPEKYPFFVRLMFKLMKAETGDFRNWEQISAWAGELTSSLRPKSAEGK